MLTPETSSFFAIWIIILLWEETSSNPSANADPIIDYITSVSVPYSLVVY